MILKENELTVKCPKCETAIPLSESLARPFIDRERAALNEREREVDARVAALFEEKKALDEQRRHVDAVVAEAVSKELEKERIAIAEVAQQNARDALNAELQTRELRIAALEEMNKKHEQHILEVRASEISIENEKLKLEQARADLEIATQRIVNQRMAELRTSVKAQAEEQYRVDIQERDLQIEQLRRDIEALRQRATQGSQQLQGEAQEVTIEQALRTAFPQDQIVPVRKGEAGGDVIQTVITPDGHTCEPILVESKRTKTWNSEWIEKLRSDQRDARAPHAVLVTQTPPKGVTTFAFVDGVWVVTRPFVVPVMAMLRQGVMQVAAMRTATAGQQTKAGLVYDYLTRGDFARRVNSVADALHGLRSDYNIRRRRIQRELATEEQKINRADAALMQLVGDFQGIAGDRLAVQEELRTALPSPEMDDGEGSEQRSA